MFDLPTLAALTFPQFDPVAIELGPLAIRWYALAYVVGLVTAWLYCRKLTDSTPARISRQDFDDFLLWATLGVVLGGRLGYVLFYNFDYYAAHPIEALYVWQGGMAFHGGFLGVVVAIVLFARSRGIPLLALSDIVACAAPIGLFLGRIANFINGELYGRVTDVPWGVIFPYAGSEPRHPSQLYQAGLEGLLLFLLLLAAVLLGAQRRFGLLSGMFLIGYGTARIIGEFFREPDAHIGFLLAGTTMGQWLSVPMVLAGVALLIYARRRAEA
ncbi:prolipoprotein diacylglyceryl transferase [Aquibaculum arenosum]|uniref:Phosphatidylglycerol--prolipoprotein diacylglyceryl transferase n=1 Tax=Aquibaculum arenosum TaxID=3032591 RepID=A0ABT5YJA6_9PROT|nr:prolipoprotein diacylglyceryl transferase [Fodinicurvata sp. CAU 1616]MDF2095031.1 prolipoprotein diacylglyceryl transferase [Fodinicurvata sp. CAU 1616]